MYSGTRIDPEEREPRAIKIRQPKNTGRKVFFSVVAVLIIIAIGGGAFAFINFGGYFEFDKFGKTAGESSVSSESEIPEESEPEIPEEPVVPDVPEESEPEIEVEPVVPEEPVEQEPVVEEDPIPRDEWFMILVNKENPLPEGFTVETSIIDDSGHAVDSRIVADLSAMIADGEKEGLSFVFYTAFRTVEKQNEFFNAGTTAIPGGASEHNCGLGIDIGCATGDFVGSPEETWLLAHAHEYGFILRYPEGKEDITGFDHEPWHFRYVGIEQAKLIHESGLCLEEYLAQ